MKRTLLLLLVPGLVAGMMAGCEKKFTEKRFDTMIVNGQSQMEVEKILGKPDAKWETSWKWVDFDEGYSGKVLFDESGSVIGKKFTSMTRNDPDPETKWTEDELPPAGDSPSAPIKGGDTGSETTEMQVTP